MTRKILALAKDGASEVTHPEMLFGKIYLIKSEGEKIVWMDEITKEVAFKELLRGILVEDIIQEKSFKFVSTCGIEHVFLLLSLYYIDISVFVHVCFFRICFHMVASRLKLGKYFLH